MSKINVADLMADAKNIFGTSGAVGVVGSSGSVGVTSITTSAIIGTNTPYLTYSGTYSNGTWAINPPDIKFGFTLKFKTDTAKMICSWSTQEVAEGTKLKKIL